MHIYCKNCKKHTGNTFPKKLILISKNEIKGKSKCAICLTERIFIDEIKDEYNLESELEIFSLLLTYVFKENGIILFKMQKKYKKHRSTSL